MENINLKYRKILYQLDKNSRQSLSQIGRKVGLSKNSVAYGIQKLKEKGIIKNYYTFIDAFRIGYTVLRYYIIYQYTTPDLEKEIIDYFIRNKYTAAVYSLNGRFDLEVVFWIKNIENFYNLWQETLRKYSDYFADQSLSFYIQYLTYNPDFLLSDKTNDTHSKKSYVMGGGGRVNIDDFDFEILKIIAPNARIPFIDIAGKLGSTVSTIKNRIKRLEKSGVIQGFRTNIDFSKLGYQYFKVDIYLKEYRQRNHIISYMKSDPHLMSINVTTGLSHLELELYLKNVDHLCKIMNIINNKFPNAIRNYKYFIFQNVHKYVFMPGI